MTSSVATTRHPLIPVIVVIMLQPFQLLQLQNDMHKSCASQVKVMGKSTVSLCKSDTSQIQIVCNYYPSQAQVRRKSIASQLQVGAQVWCKSGKNQAIFRRKLCTSYLQVMYK